MGWVSALPKQAASKVTQAVVSYLAKFRAAVVDWDRLVFLDFETYWDADYTLSKLSTSEYVRDKRFKAQMVGIKIGRGKTRIIPAARIRAELRKINWATHSVCCHNAQFDAFILSEIYGIYPLKYYCTLSMARGLHSNEIGAGLDEVSQFYGGKGKIEGALDKTKGVLNWSKELTAEVGEYCARDVDEMYRIFCEMHKVYPPDEIDLIHMTIRMFCAPVLEVDIPRVQAEYVREVTRREELMLTAIDPDEYEDHKLLKGAEKLLAGKERSMLIVKRVIGSNERFAELLRAAHVEPPVKISPAWMKKSKDEKVMAITELMAKNPDLDEHQAERELKWTYAFAKDDLAFTALLNIGWEEFPELNPNDGGHLLQLVARQQRLKQLVEVRIAVKSTTNITRAERFLKAGANGAKLPVGYAYYRAHTGRWGGNNKMNMQNLTRGGELRQCILAKKGHHIAVADSGQIEARVNGWLWGQDDLLEGFRAADTGTGLDNYCRFATEIYRRSITKADTLERFVGKVCVLGLGYQMGAAKLQLTLAKGALGGPPVHFTLEECQNIVNTYRRRNHRIEAGWTICKEIIEDMAAGIEGSYKCLSWGAGYILLPNGMSLKYPDLRKAMGDKGWEEWTYQSGDMRKKIYGGLLCENLVQALARIIVAQQMLMIDKKYPVVMTTHDEAVTHPKVGQAEKAFMFMIKCMTTPMPWCPDIPLAAEGGTAVNYSK